jgi:hypothetical protein
MTGLPPSNNVDHYQLDEDDYVVGFVYSSRSRAPFVCFGFTPPRTKTTFNIKSMVMQNELSLGRGTRIAMLTGAFFLFILES